MQALFLAAASGQRFGIHHAPVGSVRGAVLYLHPFAEEMNKSRRMAALQSRALAQAGYAVLQIDLAGCGDSSGEFVEARWQTWLDDAALAAQWLRSRHDAPLWLWGLRAGCLLAAEAAARIDDASRFLFWQPALGGQAALQQFLRLKLAAQMNEEQDGEGRQTTQALRAALVAGQAVDIAGYTLGADLALGLEQAELHLPATACEVVWLELSSRPDGALSPAAATRVQAWRDAGHHVAARAVSGPPFWQTLEIETAPALIEATLAALAAQPERAAA
jgi:uncharacterized protein